MTILRLFPDSCLYNEGSIWWCSRLRSTILAKILAWSGAVAAAAAARRTRAAPALCMRLAWCIACRPPGMVNCNYHIHPIKSSGRKYGNNNEIKQLGAGTYKSESQHATLPAEEQMQHMP